MLLLSCPSLLVASAVRPIQLWTSSLDGGGVWLRWAICCGSCKAGVNCKRHCLLSVASTIDRWTFYACEMTSLDYWSFVLRSGIELNYVCGSHSTAIWYSSWWCDVTYTVFQKRQMPNSWRQLCYLSTDFQNFSTIRFSNKFTAKYLLNIPPHLICVATVPGETLMSDNEWQSRTNAVISDKLQGTL